MIQQVSGIYVVIQQVSGICGDTVCQWGMHSETGQLDRRSDTVGQWDKCSDTVGQLDMW